METTLVNLPVVPSAAFTADDGYRIWRLQNRVPGSHRQIVDVPEFMQQIPLKPDSPHMGRHKAL